MFAKVSELPHSELDSIVSNYVIRDAELIHGLFDKFHCLGYCYRCFWLRFDAFGELVHCYEDMCESTIDFFEGTYQIPPPCRKGPGDQYGLQLIGRNVFVASKILATFTVTNQGVGIRNSRGPIKPLPVCLAYKRMYTYVAATNS
jgi:hypothetical protein